VAVLDHIRFLEVCLDINHRSESLRSSQKKNLDSSTHESLVSCTRKGA
jgi:hypothetical protein